MNFQTALTCTTWPLQIHLGADSVAIETHSSESEDVDSFE